jgi:hypothetical protein
VIDAEVQRVKMLYLTCSTEGYLADSLLLGLRALLGADVVDYPKSELLYDTCPPASRAKVRGKGFTLYGGLLPDIVVDRSHIIDRVRAGAFDVVVFSDIWRTYGWFLQLRPWLDPKHTVILDGNDSPRVYPYAGLWARIPYYWFLPRARREFLYFKREWTRTTHFGVLPQLLPLHLRQRLPAARNLRPIAFSIPEQKIVPAPPAKTKDFPAHIVDPELVRRLPGATTGYVFANEADYYEDLRSARFGITTKRVGWDCLRHYEIAANGAVPCFRDLASKPETCAPHGLGDHNCISYRDADDLLAQIAALSDERYARLQRNALQWARDNSTRARARQFLAALEDRLSSIASG